MKGRIAAVALVLSAAAAGGGMYYLQVYGFYRTLDPATVALTVTRADGTVEPLAARDLRAIDADSSPIRFRACLLLDPPLPSPETHAPYTGAVPLTAPGWFDCFDAAAIGRALEQGEAVALVSQAEIRPMVDRVLAVFPDGRAFVWHQLNPEADD